MVTRASGAVVRTVVLSLFSSLLFINVMHLKDDLNCYSLEPNCATARSRMGEEEDEEPNDQSAWQVKTRRRWMNAG
jgi:hypothetical protein